VPAVEVKKGRPLFRGRHGQQLGNLIRAELAGQQVDVLRRQQGKQILPIAGIDQQEQFLPGSGPAQNGVVIG